MDGQENYESSDGEQSIDLTETLANISRNQQQQQHEQGAGLADDDDEDEFIRLSSKKANFKAGSKVLRATTNNNNKKKNSATLTGGGSFQSLGLHPSLLRAILLRGFNSPTPIQRAALPHILASPPRDVVGMARTGSGKTLAYLIPLIQTLSGVHSVQFGIRALILVPTRELALQVLKVGKDLAKGFIQGDRSKPSTSQDSETNHKAEGLRWGLIVGGDSLEDQFTMFSTNPDV
jgi:ATP-dependent RNA helicase DDX54/DBP10